MSGHEHQQDSPETAHASQTTDRITHSEPSGVLVVYDDYDFGLIIARTLEKIGYQVDSVPYMRGTLSGLRERGYRLAVLEVRTADANGLRRLEAIREADPALPVILVSGHGASIRRIVQLGVECWIDKPFRLEEVRAAVKRVLLCKDGEESEDRVVLWKGDLPASERANSPMKDWSSLDGEKTLGERTR